MAKVFDIWKGDPFARKGFWTVSSEKGYATFPTKAEATAYAKGLKKLR